MSTKATKAGGNHVADKVPGCSCERCGVLRWAAVTVRECGRGKSRKVKKMITWRDPYPGEPR